MLLERPAIRPLEPIPIEHEGQTMIALRDASGLSGQTVMLPVAAYYLTRYMDGERTRAEIIEAFRLKSGIEVDGDSLDRLIGQLDETLALDGPRARAELERHDVRPMAHAGGAYPEEPAALKSFLDGLIAEETLEFTAPGPLVALMAPHIDLQRGAASYALAYQELLRERERFDTFVVLGISHAPTRTPFVLTRKSFATPLGVVPTDLDFVDELAAGLDFDPYKDEYNQFGEHSVEFQAVFLKHFMPAHVRMVPVLCGSFHECLDDKPLAPESLAGVASFIASLKGCLARRKRACVLASVDLAHLGQRFGGPALSVPALEALDQQDRATLARAMAGDAEGFLASLQADRGRRNYCGTSGIYTMLRVLDGPRGRLHRYQQCNEPGLTSTVTVAAAGFYAD